MLLGSSDGAAGINDGLADGSTVGRFEGCIDGSNVGVWLGKDDVSVLGDAPADRIG